MMRHLAVSPHGTRFPPRRLHVTHATPIIHCNLDASRSLAAMRAHEQSRSDGRALFFDPYAAALTPPPSSAAANALPPYDPREPPYDALTTRFLDEWLLITAAKKATPVDDREYRQVVLVGCGFDTRPYRLPWPQGTVVYLVASPESHELAEALLSVHGEECRVPEGCLLRRVDANLKSGGAPFGEALARAGYRSERLSVWALQGLCALELEKDAWQGVMQEVDNMAAFDSIVVGELPKAPVSEQAALLATHGLLGGRVEYGTDDANWNARWDVAEHGPPRTDPMQPRRALFRAVHQRTSLEQMGVYTKYRTAMEEVDEDYTENIS